MRTLAFLCTAWFVLAFPVFPADIQDENLVESYPHAVISNGIVEASVFLPDTEKGFYRARGTTGRASSVSSPSRDTPTS